jgi:hypothetical protein
MRDLRLVTQEAAVAERQQLGEVLDQLGVKQQIDADENVCGALVLLTVEEPDGHLSLRASWSEGMSWIERIGLLRAAERAELPADGAHDWRV